MFIENKYYRWYLGVTAKDDVSGVTEKHHRIPRSVGGTNEKSNLVRLTLRKHFLAHWLLTQCTEGIDRKKMLKALGCMIGNRKAMISSWQYEVARMAGREGQKGSTPPLKGKKHKPESLILMSKAHSGKVLSEEHKQNISLSGMGHAVSDETRGKISIKKIGVKLSEAHCISIGNSKRGISPSDQTRVKLSVASLGNKSKTGMTDSPETLEKKSVAHRVNLNPQSNNRLGLKGVVRHQGKFRARTKFSGKHINIGVFDCPVAAHLAYVVVNDSLLKGSST
jgi:hypothetical protein